MLEIWPTIWPITPINQGNSRRRLIFLYFQGWRSPMKFLETNSVKKITRGGRFFFCVKTTQDLFYYGILKGRQISSFKKSTKNDEKMSTCVNFDCLQLQSNFTSWHFFIVLCAIFKTTYLSTLQIPKWNKSWVVFTKKILHASWNPYW